MVARWLFGSMVLVLAGCEPRAEVFEDGPPERPAARPTRPPERPRGVDRGAPLAGDGAADDVPTVVAKPTFVAQRDEAAAMKLPEAARAELGRSPVPVLVPNEPKLLASAVVTTGPHWFAVASRDGALTVAVHGTRLAHEHREIPPARGRDSVRGRPAFFTENEGIVTASWVEDGVAYSLDLECHDRGDARCRGFAHLGVVASKLVHVAAQAGGAP